MTEIIDDISLIQYIDSGCFAETYLSKKEGSNILYATKKIDLKYIADEPFLKKYIENEIVILNEIQHPNIVKLFDVKMREDYIYLIMEYCNGGSLLKALNDYIEKNGKPFTEDIVRFLMKQILSGVECLHNHNIIHRDLKLENILLKYNSENEANISNIFSSQVKIIDFDISVRQGCDDNKDDVNSFIERYIGNEEGKCDKKDDILALGGLCSQMLFGKNLYNCGNKNQNIKTIKIKYRPNISSTAESFLKCMLQKDKDKRLKASDLLEHDFIKNNLNELETNNISPNIKSNYSTYIKIKESFSTKPQFKEPLYKKKHRSKNISKRHSVGDGEKAFRRKKYRLQPAFHNPLGEIHKPIRMTEHKLKTISNKYISTQIEKSLPIIEYRLKNTDSKYSIGENRKFIHRKEYKVQPVSNYYTVNKVDNSFSENEYGLQNVPNKYAANEVEKPLPKTEHRLKTAVSKYQNGKNEKLLLKTEYKAKPVTQYYTVSKVDNPFNENEYLQIYSNKYAATEVDRPLPKNEYQSKHFSNRYQNGEIEKSLHRDEYRVKPIIKYFKVNKIDNPFNENEYLQNVPNNYPATEVDRPLPKTEYQTKYFSNQYQNGEIEKSLRRTEYRVKPIIKYFKVNKIDNPFSENEYLQTDSNKYAVTEVDRPLPKTEYQTKHFSNRYPVIIDKEILFRNEYSVQPEFKNYEVGCGINNNQANIIINCCKKYYMQTKGKVKTAKMVSEGIKKELGNNWLVLISNLETGQFDFSISAARKGDFIVFSLDKKLFQICRY